LIGRASTPASASTKALAVVVVVVAAVVVAAVVVTGVVPKGKAFSSASTSPFVPWNKRLLLRSGVLSSLVLLGLGRDEVPDSHLRLVGEFLL